MFESKMMKLLRKMDIKVALDIGSFAGKESIKYRNWMPDANIYSCEPNPYVFDTLKKNVRDFGIDCCRVAFGGSICSIDFTLTQGKVNNAYTDGGTFLIPTAKHKETQSHLYFRDKVVKVEMTTVEAFCEKYKIGNIDFMHMDVAGYVPEVIGGLGKVRPTVIHAKVIGNEELYINALSRKQCSEMFRKIGYDEILTDEVGGFVVYILRDSADKLFSPEQINLFDILTKGKNKANEITELSDMLLLGKNKMQEFVRLVEELKDLMALKHKGLSVNDKEMAELEVTSNKPIRIVNDTSGMKVEKFVVKSIIDRLRIMDVVEKHIKDILENRGGIRPLIMFAEVVKNEGLLMGLLDQKQCSEIFKKVGREKILMSETNKTVVCILKKYINNSFPLDKVNSVDILSQGRDKINELVELAEKLKMTLLLVDEYFKSKLFG